MEMKMLYGKGAAMIHGMETALQMNFDRNLDVRQPKMWPNMPFKIVFDWCKLSIYKKCTSNWFFIDFRTKQIQRWFDKEL